MAPGRGRESARADRLSGPAQSGAALDAGDRIRAAVRLLGQHPAVGRSGRQDGTRELVVSGTRFLLVYRVETDIVTILRLFHGAQDWPNVP